MSSLERKLLKRMCAGDDFSDLNLTESMFLEDQKNWLAYKSILDNYIACGDYRSEESIYEMFGIDLFAVDASLSASEYGYEIRKRYACHIMLNELCPSVEVYVKEKNVLGAKRLIHDFAHRIDSIVQDSKAIISLSTSVEDRVSDYKQRKSGKRVGVLTPWGVLNEATLGIGEGELWFIVAKQGIGKTWGAILFGSTAYEHGKNVLFVSMENPVKKIMMRWDALNAKIPFSDFRGGMLSSDHEGLFFDYVLSCAERENYVDFVGDGVISSPLDLELFLKKKSYDLVIIDGVYLMRTTQSLKDMYMDIGAVVNALQKMALRNKVPILCTTQFGRKGKTDDEIAYTQEIVRCADVILAMQVDENSFFNKERYMVGLKFRDASPVSFATKWDLELMNFDYMFSVDSNFRRI